VLIVLATLAVVAALALGFWLGRSGGRAASPRAANAPASAPLPVVAAAPPPTGVSPVAVAGSRDPASAAAPRDSRDAELVQLRAFADDRRRLFADLAAARTETARYRQLVVDLENNAPSLLFGPGAPDDLKLIVGVGPVLERMLHQLGVTTFRQIAYWTAHDIDEFDAKLPEFPGRIRRDGWVTQARALHQSKYGEALPSRKP
jgi:predicted flap endonuclease-1-like 5' DNA nuclease